MMSHPRQKFDAPVEAPGFLLQHVPRLTTAQEPIDTPWLGRRYEGRCGQFLNFPQHSGVLVDDLPSDLLEEGKYLDRLGFLQSWLFFGLIREMLGPDVEVTYEHWIAPTASTSGQIMLISPYLPHYLHMFSEKLQSAASATQLQYWTSILEKTKTVAEKCDGVCPSFAMQRSQALSVTWSILTLGQYLSNIVLRVHHVDEATNIEQWPEGCLLEQRLESKQWCPCLVNRLKTTLSVDSLYYLTLMDWDAPEQIYAPPSRRNHAQCTSIECLADRVDYNLYKTLHTTENCACTFIGVPNIQDLYDILYEDVIPVIIMDRSADRKSVSIKLERRHEVKQADYVAFSHVWADGLGNCELNMLPTCQFLRFAGYLEELTSNAAHPFWIDTICVPRDPTHRWKALDLMGQTYALASRVLVLDGSLVKSDSYSLIDSELSDDDLVLAETWRMGISLEAMTRIVCSPWTTRLWTLPEAQLSPLLYFRFLDRSLELSDLYVEFRRWSWAGTSLPYDLRSFLVRLRPRLRTQGARNIPPEDPEMLMWPTGQAKDRFIAMLHAMEWRSTSKPIDEVLCMSTQLNLAVERIRSRPEAERLAQMFLEVKIVPTDLLFTRGPRLQHAGFHWAPASLLEMRKHFCLVPASKPDTTFGEVTSRGLWADLECIRFPKQPLPDSQHLIFSLPLASHDGNSGATSSSWAGSRWPAGYEYRHLLVDVLHPENGPRWTQRSVRSRMPSSDNSQISALYLVLGRSGVPGPDSNKRPGRIALFVAALKSDMESERFEHVIPLITVRMYYVEGEGDRLMLKPGAGELSLWHGEDLGQRTFCFV